ncbi:MAG: ABC transporter ATP-binding protein [Candidatus Thermoplasmatota archaeon]
MEDLEKPTIVANDLLVRYGKTTALDSFSAGFPDGVSGLLGPNGAGKSTFIKSVLGLIQPVSGKISLASSKENSDRIARREMIGYLPEHQCLIEDMKGFELVSYMSRLSGLPKEDAVERSHAALDFVGLGEERYREISSYSTGMKQRVKLAQSIAHDPEIILLDEPTTGMDPDGKEEMLDLIEKIGSSEKTVLISSHILNEVEQVSDYVVIINEGRAIESGYMDDIMKSDENRYKLKVRGPEEAMENFVKDLKKEWEIVQTTDKKNQLVVILAGLERTEKVFKFVDRDGLQLRYMRPDVPTLEDFFLRSFPGGEEGGN